MIADPFLGSQDQVLGQGKDVGSERAEGPEFPTLAAPTAIRVFHRHEQSRLYAIWCTKQSPMLKHSDIQCTYMYNLKRRHTVVCVLTSCSYTYRQDSLGLDPGVSSFMTYVMGC